MKIQLLLCSLLVFSLHNVFAATEPTVKVFKSAGALQCEPQSGSLPDVMRKELEKAGISVKAVACGHDGKMYTAMCGSPNGAINIFEIPIRKVSQAVMLGFAKLDSIAGLKETPCQ